MAGEWAAAAAAADEGGRCSGCCGRLWRVADAASTTASTAAEAVADTGRQLIQRLWRQLVRRLRRAAATSLSFNAYKLEH